MSRILRVNSLAQCHQNDRAINHGWNVHIKENEEKAQQEPQQGTTMPSKLYHTKIWQDRDFIIINYTGEVLYNATGFVEKNVETLSNELKDL